MFKNITIAILLFVSIFFGWQFFVQDKKLVQGEEMAKYYLDFHDEHLAMLASDIEYEVKNEIENEWKLVNKGLIDTIQLIRSNHEELLRKNLPNEEAVERYEHLLKEIWNENTFPIHYKNQKEKWPFPQTDWSEYPTEKGRAWRLMQLELDLLRLLNARVGVGGWDILNTQLYLLHENIDTTLLYKSDTVKVIVGRSWQDYNTRIFTVELEYPQIHNWTVSKGWIEEVGYFHYWCFDVNSLPESGIFEATISGKLWKATGGYESLPAEKKIFKVVQ